MTQQASSAAPGPPAGAGPPARTSPLIAQLVRLVEQDDRGALAQLRRSAGREPGEDAGVYKYVVPFLPQPSEPVAYWRERCRYLVAGLLALHPPLRRPNGTIEPMPENTLGAAFNRLAPNGSGGREAAERRFGQLLAAGEDELPDRLRQAITLLRSAGVPVGWSVLLIDLENWTRPDRRVQRRWAADFWRLPEREPTDTNPTAAPSKNQ